MRPFFLTAATLVAALPLAAQQPPRTQGRDSLRVVEGQLLRGVPTEAELRVLIGEVQALLASQRALEGELRRLRREAPGDVERLQVVVEQLGAVSSRFFPRQSALRVACQSTQGAAGEQGYLGLAFDDEVIVGEARPGAGLQPVVLRFTTAPRVTSVEVGSPAARAGLRPGDEVVAIGSRTLAGAEVDEVTGSLRAGSVQKLRIRRGADERTVELTVAPRPGLPVALCAEAIAEVQLAPSAVALRAVEVPAPSAQRPPVPERVIVREGRSLAFVATAPTVYGARFRALDDDLREVVDFRGAGVLVDQVLDGSPADAAGLRAFDIVTRANGTAVRDVAALLRITQEARRVELTVQRRGVQRVVVLSR
jgi:serine protease Do